MHFLTNKIEFPQVDTTNEHGMLAFGGDLSTERLILAYKSGIFPWYSEGEPIVWYSPEQRMVLFPDDLKISKSMRQILKKDTFKVTFNQAFEEVIFNCKNSNRKDEFGTWITDEMQEAYIKLHKLGVAKSVEVWQPFDSAQGLVNKLVGGLYGLEIGAVFCGESMFSKVSNASKVAFINLVASTPLSNQKAPLSNQKASLGNRKTAMSNQPLPKYKLIDCQMYNDHLASFGAKEIDREDFLKYLPK